MKKIILIIFIIFFIFGCCPQNLNIRQQRISDTIEDIKDNLDSFSVNYDVSEQINYLKKRVKDLEDELNEK